MKVSFDRKSPKSDALVVFATEKGKTATLLGAAKQVDSKTKGALKRAVTAEGFSGKKGDFLYLSGPAGLSVKHVVLLGLGKTASLTSNDLEALGAAVQAKLNVRKATVAEVAFPAELKKPEQAAQFSLGAQLNSYRFGKYLTKGPKSKKPTLKAMQVTVKDVTAVRKAYAPLQKIAAGVFLTRDLVSEAPNVLYPESFANIIKKEMKPLGVKVTILHQKDLEKHGMGALIAVGQGSARGPKLVTMEYKGGRKTDKNIAFVGKGVTFDTGGISLKPGPGMEDMKWDMAGAGVVTGLMKALAARKAKVNVIGVVALAENMPSSTACRPGDTITSMSGQTVEIHNTDAEGRLILCDALWYCQQKYKPTHIVDLATLTGAVIIALGHEYGGLFSNDDKLAEHLLQSGIGVNETLWRMPFHDAWDAAIDTPLADMKNIGGRAAGSATAAHFLKRFIQPGVKWAHLDIAGMAWSTKDLPVAPKGATGFGVRLLDKYVADVYEKK